MTKPAESTPSEQADTEIRTLREMADTSQDMLIEGLREEVRRQSRQIETMNARTAVDAKAYERDQYLIARLREQLAARTTQEKPK